MEAHAQVQNLLFRMHISLCAAAGGAVRRNPAPQLLSNFKRWQTCPPELRKTVRSRRHHELGRGRRPAEAAYRLGALALGRLTGNDWKAIPGKKDQLLGEFRSGRESRRRRPESRPTNGRTPWSSTSATGSPPPVL
jgi:hypothetical protein